MTLAEQLQELRENILRDKSDIIAGDTDSLWSDETLLRYIKDAERRFARRTLVLRDSTTPEYTTVKLKTGITQYPLNRTVIAVLSARQAGTATDLMRSGHALVADSTRAEGLTFDPFVPYTLAPGAPCAYYTDETLVYARQSVVTLVVYPAPSSTENGTNLNLRVIRLPGSQYSLATLDEESELPEDYQLDVLEWAAYRAQRGFDAEAGAPTTAESHKGAFEDAIKRAVAETKRKMFSNTGLQYGGNGFSWTR